MFSRAFYGFFLRLSSVSSMAFYGVSGVFLVVW